MHPLDLRFSATDGRVLAATVHAATSAPRGALVVLSALGVPRGYYARFAAWLAARDIAVLTFDYRGVGDSRNGPLRKDPATLLDWARHDATRAIDFALDRWRGVPTWGLGHSFGGQAFGLTPRARDLDGIVVAASGSGDLSLYPPALRRRYAFLLGTAVPVVNAVAGYVPGFLGIGEDLPAGVVGQWARWCGTPGYARAVLGRDATHYHRITAPMRFYDFPDDTFAPLAAAAELRSWYTDADVVHRTIAPADIGLARIGHFGLFRPGPTEAVWGEIAASILGQTAATEYNDMSHSAGSDRERSL